MSFKFIMAVSGMLGATAASGVIFSPGGGPGGGGGGGNGSPSPAAPLLVPPGNVVVVPIENNLPAGINLLRATHGPSMVWVQPGLLKNPVTGRFLNAEEQESGWARGPDQQLAVAVGPGPAKVWVQPGEQKNPVTGRFLTPEERETGWADASPPPQPARPLQTPPSYPDRPTAALPSPTVGQQYALVGNGQNQDSRGTETGLPRADQVGVAAPPATPPAAPPVALTARAAPPPRPVVTASAPAAHPPATRPAKAAKPPTAARTKPVLTRATPPATPPAHPTAAPAAGPPPVPGGYGYRVQLASYRMESSAKAGWAVFQNAAEGKLSSVQPALVPVDIPGKGAFYRLYAGPFDSRAKATAICQSLHRHHQSCLVTAGNG
ncbi:exported hypothetical protein [uncultured Gammaproteobacteria bacterium]